MSLDHLRVEGNELRKYGCEAATLLALVRWRCRLRTDGYVASFADIFDDIGMKRSSVRTARDLLEDAGELATGTVPGTRSQRWFIPDHQADPPFTHQADTPDHQAYLDDHQADPPFDPSIREDLEEVEDPPPAPNDPPPQLPLLVMVKPPQPDQFDAFWSHYPRKTGKGAARKSWANALKRAPLDCIAQGLIAQLPGLREQHARGFCPHPATWLNQDRWDDDPAAVENRQSDHRGDNPFLAMVANDMAADTLQLSDGHTA